VLCSTGLPCQPQKTTLAHISPLCLLSSQNFLRNPTLLFLQDLFEALVGLCFNEIASFVHGCQNYLRQRREIEGASAGGGPPAPPSPTGGSASKSTKDSRSAAAGGAGERVAGGVRCLSACGLARSLDGRRRSHRSTAARALVPFEGLDTPAPS